MMRRIQTKEEIERIQGKRRVAISVVFLFIMVFGTVGYAFGGFGGSDENDSGKTSSVNLAYTIEDVENISVQSFKTVENYSGKKIYIASNSTRIYSEIVSVVGVYASNIQQACYGECEEDLPQKGCEEDMIVWRESEENKVYEEDNCVIIEGNLKAVDAFLYRILGEN